MRSRADALRVTGERVLRVLTLVVLSFAAWNAAAPWRRTEARRAPGPRRSVSRSHDGRPRPRAMCTSRSTPHQAPGERDWLRALRRAGTPVTWQGEAIPALALEAMPAVAPRGGVHPGDRGTRGSARRRWRRHWRSSTRSWRARAARPCSPRSRPARLTASIGAQRAVATPRDSLLRRRLLVLGRVGWEAKFVITALEEAGWTVEARLAHRARARRGAGRARGRPTPRGTPQWWCSTRRPPATAAAITRYVRAGGGAVLAGAAASCAVAGRAVPRAAPARACVRPPSRLPTTPRAARSRSSRSSRARMPSSSTSGDGRVAAAARRVDAGRVTQLGYDETWRWRLAGGAQAPDAHRAWWSAVVASVAHRAAVPRVACTTRRRGPAGPAHRRVRRTGREPGARRAVPGSARLRAALRAGEPAAAGGARLAPSAGRAVSVAFISALRLRPARHRLGPSRARRPTSRDHPRAPRAPRRAHVA